MREEAAGRPRHGKTMENVWSVEYAGHRVRYSFLTEETHRFFGPYAAPEEGGEYDLMLPPETLELAREQLPEENSDGYNEYVALIALTARLLLRYNCSVFHATTFLYGGRAWLLTGPSGVGKSTQYMNWLKAHPGETRMLCGDKPVIEKRGDGSVWVHSSPWNGKECLGRKGLSAPVGGVVLLEQGSVNELSPLPPADSVIPLLRQFLMRPETEEEALSLCGMLDGLLCFAPVWKFTNTGDAASTEMLREVILRRANGSSGGGNEV